MVQTDTLPAVGDTVYFDVQNDRLSLWTGTGEVSSVPLDANAGALLAKTDVRKVTYDLKNAIGKLRQHGLELSRPTTILC